MGDVRALISPSDLTDEVREAVLQSAVRLKRQQEAPRPSRLRVGALYFNPSLRTRASFEQAARVVGGVCQTLNAGADTWQLELDPHAVMDGGKAENIVEAARVMGSMFHLLGIRSFRGDQAWKIEREEPVLRRFAEYAGVPVISLEGASHHPCQGLADLLTLRETFGDDLRGLPVVLSWAWHPRALPAAVPHTFLLQAALAGCDVQVVHPPGFELDSEIVDEAARAASERGGNVQVGHDRAAAYEGRRVVYVKSWGPLDGSGTTDPRLRDWLVDEASLAPTDDGRVMHCLPVRRNVVLAGEVLDGPRSMVVQQAQNRLWAQAGLIEQLAQAQGVW